MQHPQNIPSLIFLLISFIGIITRESFKDLNLMRSSFKHLWQVSSTGSTQKKTQECLFENLRSGQWGCNGRQLTPQQQGRTDYNVLVCDTIEIQVCHSIHLDMTNLSRPEKRLLWQLRYKMSSAWARVLNVFLSIQAVIWKMLLKKELQE